MVNGKRQAISGQSQKGTRPRLPDFFKPTLARFRSRLAQIVALAEAGYITPLKSENVSGAWLCGAPENVDDQASLRQADNKNIIVAISVTQCNDTWVAVMAVTGLQRCNA